MGGRVDAAGQSAHHHDPAPGEVGGEPGRNLDGIGRGDPRSDDGDRRPAEDRRRPLYP